jgi:putative resolvase
MEHSYSPREAGRILGVTTHTIQVWDRQGRIKCIRLPTGRRRIPESEIRRLLNIVEQRKEAIYARVSSYDQKSDLEKQIQLLMNKAPRAEVYSDVKSGLNFRRKGLLQLLDDVVNRRISKIYVTYEDRLARFGFDLLCWICSKYGTEIVVVNGKEAISPQEELVQDLIAIITSFSAKLYGLRSHKTKRLLTAVKEVTSSK